MSTIGHLYRMKLVRVARVLLGVSAKDLSHAASLSARELRRIEAGVVQATPAAGDARTA